MKNKGLKILLSVLLVLCIIMAGALIGKEYIGDNIKELNIIGKMLYWNFLLITKCMEA